MLPMWDVPFNRCNKWRTKMLQIITYICFAAGAVCLFIGSVAGLIKELS